MADQEWGGYNLEDGEDLLAQILAKQQGTTTPTTTTTGTVTSEPVATETKTTPAYNLSTMTPQQVHEYMVNNPGGISQSELDSYAQANNLGAPPTGGVPYSPTGTTTEQPVQGQSSTTTGEQPTQGQSITTSGTTGTTQPNQKVGMDDYLKFQQSLGAKMNMDTGKLPTYQEYLESGDNTSQWASDWYDKLMSTNNTGQSALGEISKTTTTGEQQPTTTTADAYTRQYLQNKGTL